MNPFNPDRMTPEVAAQLDAQGYNLPGTWPHPARYTCDLSDSTGWKVTHPGSIRDELLRGGKLEPLYIAPDGTKLVKVSNGKKPVLVALSKKLSPKVLCLAARARHPAWMEREKNETPESLKPFLFRKKCANCGGKGELNHSSTDKPLMMPCPMCRTDSPPPPPQVDPKLADVERRIAATPAGQRVSPGLLALRTRLLRYGGGVRPTCTGHPPAPSVPKECHNNAIPIEMLLSEFEQARQLLDRAEKESQPGPKLAARRAVYTRKLQALATEWALTHADQSRDQFVAWVTERVGSGIELPARRHLHQPGARHGMAARGPTSRFGILASGLVRIVATPKELDARKGWWRTGKPCPDSERAWREGMRDGPPRWLRRVATVSEVARQLLAQADARQREGIYIGDRHPTPYPDMTPSQRVAELGRQARRLRGHPDEIPEKLSKVKWIKNEAGYMVQAPRKVLRKARPLLDGIELLSQEVA